MSWPDVRTVDYHTGGEPFRIVAEPPVRIAGETVAARRMFAIADPSVDGLRRMLCCEPRGHADMYGGFLTPPDDDGAALGVLFWHKDGFSTACGHGTMALGVWAVESGLVEADPSGVTEVPVDVPSGRVTARVHTAGRRVTTVDFVNVASWAIAERVPVSTTRGEVRADIAYGGAFYAHVEATTLGLSVAPGAVDQLIAAGREIKWALNDSEYARHPSDDRLSGVYGTVLYDDLGEDADGNPHQRNVTIFADGQVDRSPCGSGTASRVAMLSATGRLPEDRQLVHDSIVGSRFHARVERQVTAGGDPGRLRHRPPDRRAPVRGRPRRRTVPGIRAALTAGKKVQDRQQFRQSRRSPRSLPVGSRHGAHHCRRFACHRSFHTDAGDRGRPGPTGTRRHRDQWITVPVSCRSDRCEVRPAAGRRRLQRG